MTNFKRVKDVSRKTKDSTLQCLEQVHISYTQCLQGKDGALKKRGKPQGLRICEP